MASKPKVSESTALQAIPAKAAETREASAANAARDEDIRRRAYEIYLARGEQQAAIWTIGSRLNVNSKVHRFRAHRPARKS